MMMFDYRKVSLLASLIKLNYVCIIHILYPHILCGCIDDKFSYSEHKKIYQTKRGDFLL